MAKATTQFVCQSCGATDSKWSGRCSACGAWNSLVETATQSTKRSTGTSRATTSLKAIDTKSKRRFSTGIEDFDQVLGGGIVPGSVLLLSGDPGIGKSTLVLQLAARLSADQSVLYVSGEESIEQIKLRAERLGLAQANVELLAETNADAVVATIAAGQYQFVVIDSIQTMFTEALAGGAGSVGQVSATAQALQAIAKQVDAAVLMVGHVTKDGSIAGPKILEHLVDVVLYLEGDRYGHFKALRGIKNRFGATSEVCILEMKELGMLPVKNPSAALLAERQAVAGSVVLATMEGNRPLLVEVQALVAPTAFGYPKRTAAGFDLNRLNLLVGVLVKRAGLNLSNQDIYVNIVGGLKLTEPAADLAIILSIVSAFSSRPIKSGLVAFGEVGLSGEIRSVSGASQRLAEAKKIGFKAALGPKTNATAGIIGCRLVTDAIKAALSPVN